MEEQNTENTYSRIRKTNLRLKTFLVKCEKCNEEKSLQNFTKLKKFYKKKICLSCYPKFLIEQKNKCRNEAKSNINYRLKKSLAARLRTVLIKNDTTMNYIGCNIQYLREWFEYNFSNDMNWDNYNSYWSINHIIPVCNFDLTIEDEKLKCWNWSNLIPVTVNSEIDINYIIKKIQNFKEEGSTTKWFSGDTLDLNYCFNKLKINVSS